MYRKFVENYEGVMCWEDTELFYFKIMNRQLVNWKDISNGKLWPVEPKVWGMSYGTLNDFFKRRTIDYGCMKMHEYLEQLGLRDYDVEEMTKRTNGYNHLDRYWVKNSIGAKSWKEITTQKYPIYK